MADIEPLSIREALNLPPKEMLRYLGAKDYRATVNWAEMWHDDHVRSFTVAKAARYDLLETIRGSIHDAWAKGVPLDQWRDRLIPELQEKGWWGTVKDASLTGTSDAVVVNPRRLENIFVTNFRMASAAAQWKRIQAGKAYMPFLRYRTIGDEHVRFSHARLNNIVLPVDHPFWKTYFPPNDWGCRCHVTAMNQRMLDRLGLKVTPDSDLPELAPRLFWRPGTSKPEVVPGGVGPGFGYNPGIEYLRAFQPVALDAPLTGRSVVARGPEGPVIPLPSPRHLPDDIILPDGIGERDAIQKFVESFRPFSAQVDDQLVFTDKTGSPVVISEAYFQRPDGTSKLSPDRRTAILLLAELIREPDEIWWQFEYVATNPQKTRWRWRLTRRYVAQFLIGGEKRHAFASMQVGRDGWYGVTAYPVNDRYIDKEQVRGGILGWRRTPEKGE